MDTDKSTCTLDCTDGSDWKVTDIPYLKTAAVHMLYRQTYNVHVHAHTDHWVVLPATEHGFSGSSSVLLIDKLINAK